VVFHYKKQNNVTNLSNVALNSVQSVQSKNEPEFERAKTSAERNTKMLLIQQM